MYLLAVGLRADEDAAVDHWGVAEVGTVLARQLSPRQLALVIRGHKCTHWLACEHWQRRAAKDGRAIGEEGLGGGQGCNDQDKARAHPIAYLVNHRRHNMLGAAQNLLSSDRVLGVGVASRGSGKRLRRPKPRSDDGGGNCHLSIATGSEAETNSNPLQGRRRPRIGHIGGCTAGCQATWGLGCFRI